MDLAIGLVLLVTFIIGVDLIVRGQSPIIILLALAILWPALAGASIPDDDAERTALARDRAQLEELARAYGERQITLPEYLAARKPIEARIEAAQRRITRATGTEALAPYIGQSGALRAAWSDLPLTRQRAIVAAVLDRAIVGPGLRGRIRFDPDRIEPLWRV